MSAPSPKCELIQGIYNIIDPDTVKMVPRSNFLMSLCGEIEDATSVESLIAEYTKNYSVKKSAEEMELSKWAGIYIELVSKGARLPKFTRWITGMWADNKEFAKIMASEGQKAAGRKVFMSVSPMDILRCADTPHFASCFKWPDNSTHRDASKVRREEFHRLPATILEECPGIGIMYVDDEKGKMMGRQWMHHARLKSNGEDVVVLTNRPYGCLRGDYVAKLLAQRGVRVAIAYDGYAATNTKPVDIDYIGCFTSSIHHDVDTWSGNRKCVMVGA